MQDDLDSLHCQVPTVFGNKLGFVGLVKTEVLQIAVTNFIQNQHVLVSKILLKSSSNIVHTTMQFINLLQSCDTHHCYFKIPSQKFGSQYDVWL
jgi:hypothetical protein